MNAYKIQGKEVLEEMSFKSHTVVKQQKKERKREAKHRETVKQSKQK